MFIISGSLVSIIRISPVSCLYACSHWNANDATHTCSIVKNANSVTTLQLIDFTSWGHLVKI